jgi:nucleoside 2-deoxyribosyltransferase
VFWCGDNAAVTIRRIYLAGPDVFRPDAAEYGRKLIDLCSAYGFQGIFPLDESVAGNHRSLQQIAGQIYRANLAKIESCDAVLANLDFFRGLEPDSGTCFEVGYAVARGKVVLGYVQQEGTFAERMRHRDPNLVGKAVDANGWRLEEFGLALNLMLAVPCRIFVGDAAAALAKLKSEQAAIGGS